MRNTKKYKAIHKIISANLPKYLTVSEMFAVMVEFTPLQKLILGELLLLQK